MIARMKFASAQSAQRRDSGDPLQPIELSTLPSAPESIAELIKRAGVEMRQGPREETRRGQTGRRIDADCTRNALFPPRVSNLVTTS